MTIEPADEFNVKGFLKRAEESLVRFRYFNKRPISIMRNHVATFVGREDGKLVSYGHLDPEGGNTWLGICVASDSIRKGYGKSMMERLLKEAESKNLWPIWLSVDADNAAARKLYESFGFRIQKKDDDVCFYTKEKGMDTLGGLVDKLITVDLKMWNNQELLYELRRMSFEEFKEKYWKTEDGAKNLWACLKKACDLNVQRNQLIDELDEKFIKLLQASARGEEMDDGRNIQRKHKTY